MMIIFVSWLWLQKTKMIKVDHSPLSLAPLKSTDIAPVTINLPVISALLCFIP